jgi:hypothetical protein
LTRKRSTSGVLNPITSVYDVPLIVVRGFPSKDFVHSAAEAIERIDKPASLYYFGDRDPSGLLIWDDIRAKIDRYTYADVRFERVAVSEKQIAEYAPPTRPTRREGNTHASRANGRNSKPSVRHRLRECSGICLRAETDTRLTCLSSCLKMDDKFDGWLCLYK